MIISSNCARLSLDTLAYPYPGRSTRYQECWRFLSSLLWISKKFISCVLPGLGEVWTSVFLLQIALIKLDFPTLERQIKAYSGLSLSGQCSNNAPLFKNVAEMIFIKIRVHKITIKYREMVSDWKVIFSNKKNLTK